MEYTSITPGEQPRPVNIVPKTDQEKRKPNRRKPKRRKKPDGRCMKLSHALPEPIWSGMEEAWCHARLIKRDLDHQLTIRPGDIDLYDLRGRKARFCHIYRDIQTYCRRRKFYLTCIWSLESKIEDGSGQHLHMLLHLPPGEVQNFKAWIKSKFPGRNEVDLRFRDQETRWSENGKKLLNASTYIRKAAPWGPAMAKGSTFPYRPSGAVLGTRGGWTKDIGPEAILEYRAKIERRADDARIAA